MYAAATAPIDPRNGLPYPTILIGHASSNSLLNFAHLDYGSVPANVYLSDNHGATRPCQHGVIRDDDRLTYHNINNGTIQNRWGWQAITSDTSDQWSYNYWSNGGHNQNENITAVNHRSNLDKDVNNLRGLEKNPNDPSYLYVAHSSGISMIKDGQERRYSNDAQSIYDSKVAYITSEYNTGWMFGDIRCCVLASCMSTDDLGEATTKILSTLTPREERVLRMRFGVGMNTDHTLEEVGLQFSVTRERIRQIEAKALRKLKHPSRSKQLKSFLES